MTCSCMPALWVDDSRPHTHLKSPTSAVPRCRPSPSHAFTIHDHIFGIMVCASPSYYHYGHSPTQNCVWLFWKAVNASRRMRYKNEEASVSPPYGPTRLECLVWCLASEIRPRGIRSNLLRLLLRCTARTPTRAQYLFLAPQVQAHNRYHSALPGGNGFLQHFSLSMDMQGPR